MEYEMEEEGELLDESNNPSLDHSTKQAIKNRSSVKPGDYLFKDRALRKGELIPEESGKA